MTLTQSIKTDIAIVGAGPTGLFAAFEAGMLGMKSVIIDVLPEIGGQCTALYPEKPIYDIPGHPSLTGEQLIKNLSKQIEPFNPQFLLNQSVDEVISSSDAVEIKTSTGTSIECKALIIAAGCGAFTPNRPPLQGIEEFENKNIFYSVTNQSKFQDKTVMIAGGGDSALDWSVILASITKKIYLIHRRDKFRGHDDTIRKVHDLEKQGKIEFVIPYQLHSILNQNGIFRGIVAENFDDKSLKEFEIDYLLPFFGLKMELGAITNWGLNLNKSCISVNPSTMETNIKRIFGVGDIVNYPGKLKLILTGFSEGALACHSAYNYVFPDKALHFSYSTTKGIPTS